MSLRNPDTGAALAALAMRVVECRAGLTRISAVGGRGSNRRGVCELGPKVGEDDEPGVKPRYCPGAPGTSDRAPDIELQMNQET